MLEDFITTRICEVGISAKTANRTREVLHKLFNYAIKKWSFVAPDRRHPNPAALVQRRSEPPRVIRFLTTQQIARQLEILADQRTLHAMVATLIYAGPRRTLIVFVITGAMMVVEIVTGLAFGSMALLADGLHMASHAVALAIAYFAYIFAPVTGRYVGAMWLDPAMGVVGIVLVARWSVGLIRVTSHVLLDRQAPDRIHDAIRESVEAGVEATFTDLHVCSIGPGEYATMIGVATDILRSPVKLEDQAAGGTAAGARDIGDQWQRGC